MGVNFAILTLLTSCCVNVVFLEHLINASPDSGNILLFLQFSFIALEGFICNQDFGRKKRNVPLKDYAVMVSLFFISNTTNNMALGYSVPMPLHMIFKSGSLVANMLLGSYLLKRKYSFQKYISVIMVTLGILICTYVTSAGTDTSNGSDISSTAIGVMFLTISLIVSARTGIFQESLSLKYGKHPRETLFYNHALPLPLFIFLVPSIMKNFHIFNESEPSPVLFFSNLLTSLNIPFVANLEIPILWQYVAINVLTQYFCIRSVFYLVTECSSLTVTLLLTLRKFLSLLFSVLYFKNDFTEFHWIGTSFVFIGSLMYSDVISFFNKKPDGSKQHRLANGSHSNGHSVQSKKID